MQSNVNFESYRIFYYIVKSGSITAAAHILNISQPAVSQAAKQLEHTLGTTLFLRSPKGIRLTSEGEVLYRHVAPGVESLFRGEQLIRKMTELHAGEIRIGASDMTLQFYLLPYLERFHEAYPDIKVSVTNGPTPETLEYMRQGRIDFGVVSSPIEEEEGLNFIPVKDIHDIFIAGPKFSSYKDRILNYQELEDIPIICLEERSSTRKYINQFLGKKGVVLHPEFELATSDMIIQFVLRNLGIGFVMEEFALPYIQNNRLFPLTFQPPLPKREFSIVTGQDAQISTASRALLKLLLK